MPTMPNLQLTNKISGFVLKKIEVLMQHYTPKANNLSRIPTPPLQLPHHQKYIV